MGAYTGAEVADLVKGKALEHNPEGFGVVSGRSAYYCDVKHALAQPGDLRGVANAIIEVAREKLDIDFTSVGGPTMGADPLTYAISYLSGASSFSIIKEADLPHAKSERPWLPEDELWVVGEVPKEGDQVLWVEDLTSSGSSCVGAMERFRRHPVARLATIAGVVTPVDRGDTARRVFAEAGIPFASLIDYHDLGIPPIEQG